MPDQTVESLQADNRELRQINLAMENTLIALKQRLAEVEYQLIDCMAAKIAADRQQAIRQAANGAVEEAETADA